jgi:hypothetical protein
MIRTLQKTLFALLTIVSAHASVAQFNWGVRTGFQYSTLHFNKADDWNSWKSSYLVPGVFGHYDFNERTALSFDVLFSKKGFRQNSAYHLSYLNTPLMFHYKPTRQFSVFGGVEFGVKLYSALIIDGEDKLGDDIFDNRFDWGIGGGFAVELFPGYSIMLRYTHGLSNVLGKDAVVWSNGSYFSPREQGYKFNNQAFQILFSSVLSGPKGERKYSPVSIGIRQGILGFTLYGSGITELGKQVKHRVGYEAGLEVRFEIRKYFFVSTGLSYLQEGGRVEGDDPVKLDYLSLPIIIGVSPVKTKELTFSFEGGFLVNRQVKSVNPYAYEGPNNHAYRYTSSFLYGYEVSTDAISGVTLFVNYRNFVGNNFYDTENHEFITKGRSISLGMRLRNEPRPAREEISKTGFSFGLKGGLNLSNTAHRKLPQGYKVDGQNHIGFHSGLFFRAGLTEKFALIPELQYVQKSKYLKLIEVPLILSYRINDFLSLEAGPQLGVLLNSNERRSGSFVEYYSGVMDFGLNGGMQLNLTERLSLACRYYHGLKDIVSWYEDGLRMSIEGYNRNIQVSTYYALTSKR